MKPSPWFTSIEPAPATAGILLALVGGGIAIVARPAPAPDRCTALFEAAKQDAIQTLGVRFERSVPTGDFPDEMTFHGPRGAEVEFSIEPDRRQLGSDLIFDAGDDLPGWHYDLYSTDGLTLGTYEAAANGVYVRFRIDTRWNRDDDPAENIRPGLVQRFTQAGDRCLRR